MYDAKKASRRTNSDRDPGIEHRENDALQMMEGNAAGLLHPVREHGVTRRRKDGHSSQHKILAKGHLRAQISSFRRQVSTAVAPT